MGLSVDTNVDTKIIIDNNILWAQLFDQALQYIECQLRIAKVYCLTLSLKKSHFFAKRFEFVGIDVSPDGNRPAMSKHKLLRSWPTPSLVCDVANLLASSNSTVNLSLASNFVLSRSELLCYGNVSNLLVTCGHPTCNPPLTPLGIPSSRIPAYAISTLQRELSYALIFCQRGLAMLFANQTMIMFLCNKFCSLCRAMGFTSLLLPMVGYYTLLRLVVDPPTGTRNIYTRIWARLSAATMP